MEGKAVIVGDKFEVEKGVFAECPGKSGTARNDCNCRCFLEYKLVTIEEAAKLTGKSEEDIEKIIEKTAEFVDSGDKSGLTEINKMAGGGVDWSKAEPVVHSKEVQKELVEYGKSKDVNVYAISRFDGDPSILKEQIDIISDMVKEYKIDKRITITFKKMSDDDDFARTENNTIIFNTRALRNREITNVILDADNILASADIRGIATLKWDT